jgi:hypothetical protein
MKVAIITSWKVQLLLCVAKDFIVLEIRDPDGGPLHP